MSIQQLKQLGTEVERITKDDAALFIIIIDFFIINFMWYKVYSCNLLLPSL